MGQDQRYCHALACRQSSFLPASCAHRDCPRGEYIVERILDRRSEAVCWEGRLHVTGLPSNLCPAFALQEISVACIQPLRRACASSHTWLQLLLSCLVCDCYGRSARGSAVIEVCVCSALALQEGMNVRRGAQIQVNRAAFCACDTFDASLQIGVMTVVSSLCGITGRGCMEDCCKQFMHLPLYPKPASAAFRPM